MPFRIIVLEWGFALPKVIVWRFEGLDLMSHSRPNWPHISWKRPAWSLVNLLISFKSVLFWRCFSDYVYPYMSEVERPRVRQTAIELTAMSRKSDALTATVLSWYYLQFSRPRLSRSYPR